MNHLDKLYNLFSDSNRAEWPIGTFKQLFVEPTYQKKLESRQPCFLIGGRGTGKTTALQSLRYETTLERLQSEGLSFGELDYLGILIRMNKNRVLAFQGNDVDNFTWNKAFSHYINLLICLELSKLILWLENKTGQLIEKRVLIDTCTDLGIQNVESSEELFVSIKNSISKLQIAVNNAKSSLSEIKFSMSEAPLRTLSEGMSSSKLLGGRVIFCCIDEYENLLNYQQAILNTYIKHAEPPLSFKIGVRLDGLKTRQTLETQDPIKTPDDYAEINIVDEGFEYFARTVAEKRLEYAISLGANVPTSLKSFLDELSFSEELRLLGADRIADEVLAELKVEDISAFNLIKSKPKTEIYFLKYWQEKSGESLASLAKDWISNNSTWATRIENHGYASLFWITKGRKGTRTRKYYAGARTFLTLPAGNIRYFLELLHSAIKHQIQNDKYESKGSELTISAKSQTEAVKDVGLRRLEQLESLAESGIQLKRLVLGIGKVFFELNRSAKSAPEINSFILSGSPKDILTIRDILKDGVSNLAFEAEPSTKPTSNFEVREEEYRIHRIYSGFFEISHRKKRRITFDARDLLNILEDKPSKAISVLLQNQEQSKTEDLPKQMALFNAFFTEPSEG